MPIHFDDTVPPNILITITGKVDADEYDSYHDVLRKRMLAARAARIKLGIMVDGRSSTPPGAKERKRMAEFLEENEALLAETVAGQVIVLSNALQRGVLTAILWVRPFPMPHYLASSREEGMAWLATLRREAA
jgi:hypothetical protein